MATRNGKPSPATEGNALQGIRWSRFVSGKAERRERFAPCITRSVLGKPCPTHEGPASVHMTVLPRETEFDSKAQAIVHGSVDALPEQDPTSFEASEGIAVFE